MTQSDFAHLHTPYRGGAGIGADNGTDPASDNDNDNEWGYTPGGWLAQLSSTSTLDSGFIYHDGSNTMNYAYAYVKTGNGNGNGTNGAGASAGVITPNIGLGIDGSNTVGPALYRVMDSFVNGEGCILD